jgi:hypothetical protein
MRTARTTALFAVIATVGALIAPVARAELGFHSVGFSIASAPPAGAPPGAVGPPQLQAGSHPYQVDASFELDRVADAQGQPVPAGALKDLRIELPPGLTGSLVGIPRCPMEEFQAGSIFSKGCPGATQVGTLRIVSTTTDIVVPMFNLEPPPGVAARLGAFAFVSPVVLGVSVRTGDDYGLTVDMRNLIRFLPVLSGSLRLWGVPADPGHDTLRGECFGLEGQSLGSCPSTLPRMPFLNLPTECSGPPQVTLRADSWERPGDFVVASAIPRDAAGDPLAISDCDGLDFKPDMEVRSESRAADSPSAFAVGLSLPQSANPDGRSEAGLRDASIALPAGVSINPSAAQGLGACHPEEIRLESPLPARCPDSSRIGSVAIESPMIADPLRGAIYLAAPRENVFGSMLAVYFTAERDGVLFKLAGRIDADPDSGRLGIRLGDMPQLPFSTMALRFDGGPRAPLAMPPACGVYKATAGLVPRSAPLGEEVSRSSSFTIDRGCGGRFSPSFVGGAADSLAGRRTDLVLGLSRADGEEGLRALSATLPRGFLPLLAGISSCPERAAAAGSCAPASRIGSIDIAAGAGSNPIHFPGSVFLTGPFGGAPFGLSIVVPAIAGPFDLGTIVVRAAVSVDPDDARVTILTAPLPRVLRGIPLRIRGFRLTSQDRPGLFVAPTSCDAQSVTGSASGLGGAVGSLASPFSLAGCSALRFTPAVSASTDATVTRAAGASLRFAVRAGGEDQANLRSIRIRFPGRLAPRLAAIQSACPQATFARDPKLCPPASRAGRVAVRSPILDVPLRGPAYLVSRGSEALPRLVLLPRARGVLLRISGALRVAAGGVASANFASIPDAPISSLSLNLPSGPDAVLGASFLDSASGSMCGLSLAMPVTLGAQSGARVARAVPVSIRGCPHGAGRPRREAPRR